MKKFFKRIICLLLISTCVLTLTGCKGPIPNGNYVLENVVGNTFVYTEDKSNLDIAHHWKIFGKKVESIANGELCLKGKILEKYDKIFFEVETCTGIYSPETLTIEIVYDATKKTITRKKTYKGKLEEISPLYFL